MNRFFKRWREKLKKEVYELKMANEEAQKSESDIRKRVKVKLQELFNLKTEIIESQKQEKRVFRKTLAKEKEEERESKCMVYQGSEKNGQDNQESV